MESSPEHQSGARQSEREGKPDARQTPIEDESEEVACWKGDDEVCDESNVHHRFYVGNSTEGVRVIALHPVSELVDDERDDEACHHEGHLVVIGKPSSDFVLQYK